MEETRKPARKPRAATASRPAAKKTATAGKAAVRKAADNKAPAVTAAPSPVGRDEMVRVAAYFRAERRGFQPGYEWDDWLAAEADVTALAGPAPAPKGRKAPARKPRLD